MNERRVWIAQCMCRERHCILATAGEADSQGDAERTVRAPLRRAVAEMIASEEINPWCGLCDAAQKDWIYTLGRTRFTTMDEATPELHQLQAEQAMTRTAFADLHKRRPN